MFLSIFNNKGGIIIEKRDLYDENRKLTGETIIKGENVPKGKYYVTVVVWIQNEKGDFLIQKRAIIKDGKWATTGGHPVSGQTSIQGLYTEIKEELGVDFSDKKPELFKTIRTEDDFIDLYYIKTNINLNKLKIAKRRSR